MGSPTHFAPLQIGVTTTVRLNGSKVGGFLPYTSGTLTLKDGGGNIFVNAVPVTAGIWVPLPFSFVGGDLAVATTAAGASGVLAV